MITGSLRLPAVLVEHITTADPCMAWRASHGDLHACGPSADAAIETLRRVLEAST